MSCMILSDFEWLVCGQEIETAGAFLFTCFSYSVNSDTQIPYEDTNIL